MLHRIHQLEHRRKCRIGIWDRFSRLSGWRKSAFVNTALVSTVFLILLSSHIYLCVKSGRLDGHQIIHSGSCAGNGVGRLNTLLHLVINILSSLVLASTNFFMQVLNAPSRAELDCAHTKGSWLDIGVPSRRNTFRVSRFKTIMWLLFFVSSVPIHLLFNSVLFATDNRDSEFGYFVLDESFLIGGSIFDPGTSLALPYEFATNTITNKTALEDVREWYFAEDRPRRSLTVQKTVEAMLHGDWHKIDKSSCALLYNTTHCSGLRSYRSVALILRGSSGWNRSQVWHLPEDESSIWDAYVPKDVNNSLWFASPFGYGNDPCFMQFTWTIDEGGIGKQVFCENSCNFGMGFEIGNADTWSYLLFPDGNHFTEMVSVGPTQEFGTSRLSIEYCLVEPFETVCQIGLALTLLWVVSICVLLKAVLCFIVFRRLGKETSLVTPGDVIESFLCHPPDYLPGPCILGRDCLRASGDREGTSPISVPIRWSSKRHRRWHAIPKRIWLSSYFIFSVGIVMLIYFFCTSYPGTGWQGSFGQNAENAKVDFPNFFSPTFEQAILIANLPQLFLSFTYLAFNSLFTRLHMAKEWSAMSTRYKALRVTNPQGQQSSTYFLQLPYRYSVPMLITSIMLHWVLSGCIYLLVMQGGYFESSGTGGPLGSVLAVGFSTKSLFTMMTLSIFLTLMPPIFGLIPLPPNTVVVGSNSLAIAAACQVSPLVGQNQPRPEKPYHESTVGPEDVEIEMRHLMAPNSSVPTCDDQALESRNDEEVWNGTLLRVSQSKIKWGVVKMPPSWEEQFNRQDISVEHISFGLREDDVQQPIVGHWYA